MSHLFKSGEIINPLTAHYASMNQEDLQRYGCVEYMHAKMRGSPHDPTWTISCFINGRYIAKGSGTSKAYAKLSARINALEVINGSKSRFEELPFESSSQNVDMSPRPEKAAENMVRLKKYLYELKNPASIIYNEHIMDGQSTWNAQIKINGKTAGIGADSESLNNAGEKAAIEALAAIH